MKQYSAIIHHDPGAAFGLTFPDLPGCFAAADCWDDVPKAASEALNLWFEDQPEVPPSPLDALLKRQDVAQALAEGATLITIPYIPADGTLERVNISIERGLLRAVDAAAKERGMTRSSFLASAARHELTGA
ncbi:type II toxin-antitoxin system HicB family antitoxin [Paracoccus sp. SMMA_5_TC]|nr:type II toxin-antitoxin system HicB family antitoxin [Paracoccus sp. SMMA_5_TC]UXU79610.1 type II toxin-antitoxin system HicB family antitoxin [Paracoccus sp. SMMA_5_TC]